MMSISFNLLCKSKECISEDLESFYDPEYRSATLFFSEKDVILDVNGEQFYAEEDKDVICDMILKELNK